MPTSPTADFMRDCRDWLERREREAFCYLPTSLRKRSWALRGGSVRQYALVDSNRSFLCVLVPKAANSTVRRVLWSLMGVEVSDDLAMRALHGGSGPYETLAELNNYNLRRVFKSSDTFKFTFVRNPYDRLRSAYVQKFIELHSHEDEGLYLKNINWTKDRIPTFEEFIQRASDQHTSKMNPHWTPQYRCALVDLIHYDFIGKVETFTDDMNEVMGRLGHEASLTTPVKSVNQTHSIAPPASYNERTAELVFNRYKRDFDTFGYAADSFRKPARLITPAKD